MRAITRLSLVVLLLLHACGDPTVPLVQGPPLTLIGQWSSVQPAPLVQIHLTLLPSGKVLSWGRVGDPQVWDSSERAGRGRCRFPALPNDYQASTTVPLRCGRKP